MNSWAYPKASRSKTYAVNTVVKRDKKGNQTTTINLFIEGVPADSVVVPGDMPVGKAMVYIGTRLLMEDK